MFSLKPYRTKAQKAEARRVARKDRDGAWRSDAPFSLHGEAGEWYWDAAHKVPVRRRSGRGDHRAPDPGSGDPEGVGDIGDVRAEPLELTGLAGETEILMMDEPTAALDLSHQLWVAAWLKRLVREDGLALVFATHDPNQAYDIATDVLLLHRAPDHELGAAEAMLAPPRLSWLFDCHVRQVSDALGGKNRSIFVASRDTSSDL